MPYTFIEKFHLTLEKSILSGQLLGWRWHCTSEFINSCPTRKYKGFQEQANLQSVQHRFERIFYASRYNLIQWSTANGSNLPELGANDDQPVWWLGPFPLRHEPDG
jgi:hypothetical protein